MMVFRFPSGSSRVLVTDAVVEHLLKHRQLRCWQREAGGQLFARFDGDVQVIEKATGPRPSDKRSRRSYRPNLRAEQAEIFQMHEVGLHYVGDWHTHPERVPTPSYTDKHTMADCVAKSHHQLDGFLLFVVGTDEPPTGMHVTLVRPYSNIVLVQDIG